MKRENRIRRIEAFADFIKESQQEVTPEALAALPLVSEDGQFGNHEIFFEDFTLQFNPNDLPFDKQIFWAANKTWISLVADARKKKLPYLYYLNPDKATLHEKYFGIKTDNGFVHTPATASLFRTASLGLSRRTDLSKLVRLETPSEKTNEVGQWIVTLAPEAEAARIRSSVENLREVGNRPDLLRRQVLHPGDELGEMTGSHTRGPRQNPVGTDVMPDTAKAISLITKSLERDIEKYPRLQSTLSEIKRLLDTRVDALLKEQYAVNRTIRFEGSKEQTAFILKHNLLRIILESLTADGAALQGTNLYEMDYRIPK